MTRLDFPRRIKSTFYLCIVLLSYGLCQAQPAATIGQGELRLDGNVVNIDAANGEIVLQAQSFTLASGKSSAINPAKSKPVLLTEQTQFLDANGKSIAKSVLKQNAHIAVIGADGGSGKALTARVVILLDATAAASETTSPPVNKNGLQAGEYLLNGQIKGVFSAETIVVNVYKRTDAQGKAQELGQPVEQKLHLDANTKIISAEDSKKAMTVADIKLGQRVAVSGKYAGENAPFNVRVMEVAKEETQDLEKIGMVRVNPLTAKFLEQGESALNAGAYPEAVQYYSKASQVAGSLGDTGGNSLAQSSLGIAYGHMNQPQKAVAAFTTSINLSKSINDYSSAAITMSNMGDFYLRNKGAADALKCFDTSLGWIASNPFNGRDKLKADVLFGKAQAQHDLKQSDQAIDTLHQAIAVAQQLNDAERQQNDYQTLAFWLIGAKQNDAAKDAAQQSAALIPQLKTPESQAQSWGLLYLFYRLIKDDKDAQSAFDQSKLLLTTLKDEEGLKKLQQLKEGLDKRDAAKQTPKQ